MSYRAWAVLPEAQVGEGEALRLRRWTAPGLQEMLLYGGFEIARFDAMSRLGHGKPARPKCWQDLFYIRDIGTTSVWQTRDPVAAIIVWRRGNTDRINVDEGLEDVSDVRFVIVVVADVEWVEKRNGYRYDNADELSRSIVP